MIYRDLNRLKEIGSPRFWRRRQLHARRTASWARVVANVRSFFVRKRMGATAAGRIVGRSLATLALAVAMIAALEALSLVLVGTEWGANIGWFEPPESSLQETSSALVAAAIGVGATLLGLYYATIGVIASTIYKSVPGDVRELFIAERNSEAYLKIVILTIGTSVVVLAAGVLGYAVSGMTLVVVGFLAALACVGLIVLARRLFDYFDPSKLSSLLLGQIADGIREATGSRTRALPHRQSEAHYRVYSALASFRHLVDLLGHEELRNATAPMSLTRQLLDVVGSYSSWKYAIPTDSNWWDRVPSHSNWLTIDHSRLELALNASVSYPPDLRPDYLWLENTVARLLRKSLQVGFQSQAGANALAITESIADLVANLAARLQIDEALAIEAAWDDVILDVATTPQVAEGDAPDYQIRINQMAAAESLVLPLTKMVLGLEYAARSILGRDLSGEFEAAVSDPNALYRGHLPTLTRQMLEEFSRAIRRETEAEGHRVTPRWWIDHFAARSMAEALLATESGVLQEVGRRTTAQVAQFAEQGRHDLAAVTGMASLELLSKIETHAPTIRRALAKLDGFRNENASVPQWPERGTAVVDPQDAHTAMLATLAALLPELRIKKFEPREPDLYGQLYQFVVDGAFRAILSGDRDRALILYQSALLEMEPARMRILADLERHETNTRVVFAVEPLIAAMDLAGYALLMFELDGKGIWPEIKSMWDTLLTDKREVAEFLLTAASFVDGTFAMTVGGLERSRRSIEMGRVFEARQVGGDERMWDGSRWRPHESAIVSALAPRGYGIQDDLYELFIAEYLVAHLPDDAKLGHKADMLADQIARYRGGAGASDGAQGESDA